MPQILTECQRCHKHYFANSTRAKYCPQCAHQNQIQRCRMHRIQQPGMTSRVCPICHETFSTNGTSTLCRYGACLRDHAYERDEWKATLRKDAVHRYRERVMLKRKPNQDPGDPDAKERKRLCDRERQRQYRRDAKKRPHSLHDRFFTPGSMSQLSGRKFERAVNNYLDAVK